MPLTLPYLASYILGTLFIAGYATWVWYGVRHWGVGAAALGFGLTGSILAVGVESLNQIIAHGRIPSLWLMSKLSVSLGLTLGGLIALTAQFFLHYKHKFGQASTGS